MTRRLLPFVGLGFFVLAAAAACSSSDSSAAGACDALDPQAASPDQGGGTVDCEGKCQGTCAPGGAFNGPGNDPKNPGRCYGTCDGVCNPDRCQKLSTASEGEGIVANLTCQKCHMQNLAGTPAGVPDPITSDPPNTVFLYPPNLTPDPETGIGSWTDDEIALAVRKGVDKDSQHLCPQMNHFANLDDQSAYSVVAYLKSLPPVHQAIPRSICPQLKRCDDPGAACPNGLQCDTDTGGCK